MRERRGRRITRRLHEHAVAGVVKTEAAVELDRGQIDVVADRDRLVHGEHRAVEARLALPTVCRIGHAGDIGGSRVRRAGAEPARGRGIGASQSGRVEVAAPDEIVEQGLLDVLERCAGGVGAPGPLPVAGVGGEWADPEGIARLVARRAHEGRGGRRWRRRQAIGGDLEVSDDATGQICRGVLAIESQTDGVVAVIKTQAAGAAVQVDGGWWASPRSRQKIGGSRPGRGRCQVIHATGQRGGPHRELGVIVGQAAALNLDGGQVDIGADGDRLVVDEGGAAGHPGAVGHDADGVDGRVLAGGDFIGRCAKGQPLAQQRLARQGARAGAVVGAGAQVEPAAPLVVVDNGGDAVGRGHVAGIGGPLAGVGGVHAQGRAAGERGRLHAAKDPQAEQQHASCGNLAQHGRDAAAPRFF